MISAAFVWRAVIQARMQNIGVIRLGLTILGLATWVLAASIRDQGDVMMALVALGSVAILRAAVGLRLDNPILVRLGIVSYGLYVYHELMLNLVKRILPHTHGLLFPLWWWLSLIATMIVAFASVPLVGIAVPEVEGAVCNHQISTCFRLS